MQHNTTQHKMSGADRTGELLQSIQWRISPTHSERENRALACMIASGVSATAMTSPG